MEVDHSTGEVVSCLSGKLPCGTLPALLQFPGFLAGPLITPGLVGALLFLATRTILHGPSAPDEDPITGAQYDQRQQLPL